MIAHGFVDRPIRDVDLFTEIDPDEATQVVTALRIALEGEGLHVLHADRPLAPRDPGQLTHRCRSAGVR